MMDDKNQFMGVIQRAIGMYMANDTPLTEAIADICEAENVDVELMGLWIKQFPGLFKTIETNSKKHKLLKDYDPETFSLEDWFQ
jgi:hypothetical protein